MTPGFPLQQCQSSEGGSQGHGGPGGVHLSPVADGKEKEEEGTDNVAQ